MQISTARFQVFSARYSRRHRTRRTMAKKVKAKKFGGRRAPLLKREVDIIRRLKNVVKLPITKIALAVNRNKSLVYSAMLQEGNSPAT